jgi:hypothetical protein
MKRLLKNRHDKDKKYNTVTINTFLFQSSNFFPQEGIAPSGSEFLLLGLGDHIETHHTYGTLVDE